MDRHRRRGGGPAPLSPATAAGPSPAGFMLCPVPYGSPAELLWQQELYRWALAQAEAVVRPSILERDPLAAWN